MVADRDNCIRCVALNQFEYIAKVVVVWGVQLQLFFDYSYEEGIDLTQNVFFPLFKQTLMDITESVQKATIDAFVACCSHIHRDDQGKYTYLFILQVSIVSDLKA